MAILGIGIYIWAETTYPQVKITDMTPLWIITNMANYSA